MFKSVDYSALDGDPNLKAKAEHATGVLGGLIGTWRDDTEVRWCPAAPGTDAVLELTLALTVESVSGTATGGVGPRGYAPGHEHALRIDLRDVLLDLFGVLSRRQLERIEAFVFEPTEV